ncbi:MAG: glycoside hydrolase family 97 protein [Bacteroidetes bacterium]|nr:MAG: glycoside hydrolase family 97 protein [Bacteroidota bacterium]
MPSSKNILLILVTITSQLEAQKMKTFTIASPDGGIEVKVIAGEKLQWTATHRSQTILAPSTISLTLYSGEVLGNNPEIRNPKSETINNKIAAINYKKETVPDNYNQLTLNCKGDYGIIFRAYNDGVAYRFFTKKKDSLIVRSEEANFNFSDDDSAYIPYSNDPHNKDKYQCSFENTYQHIRLSQFVKDTVAFAPVLVELANNKKAVITEADLEEYPGMFLTNGKTTNGLSGDFAPYVLTQLQNERNPVQALVTRRAGFIAKTKGTRTFPWRIVIISTNDKDLLNNDMVYRLASPSRVTDVSWIRPGKVAWDWWNDWNIAHVDFRAGVNTATYKYYADFAAANHIDYILLDEGWSDDRDIMKIVPEINLKDIIDYAAKKNVGVWLWMGSYPLDQKMEEAFSTYSKLGVRGFKIDFMDRDDQSMVEYYYRVAKTAATHHIMVDFHGAYKPTGLQRTYPNVVNVEGVHGMEQLKWSNPDMPKFDVTIPFVRMIAGPMDYTPGAMRNATKQSFRPIYSQPMSQGTRCHQLAMYIMYEAPFEMLSDNPTVYMREQESVNFIASIPTTVDETVALDGKVGEYALMARRKAREWYVGGMSNWNARDVTIDLSFLKDGNYEAEIFKDGINADRDATDYKKEVIKVSSKEKLNVYLSNGGGWAARIYPSH